MSSCISAPSEVVLPKSSFEERGDDPTSYGTFVIPTPTSATCRGECHPQRKGRNAGDASKALAGTAGMTAQTPPAPCTGPQSVMGEKPSPTCAVTKQRRRHLQHDPPEESRRPLLPGDRQRRLQHGPTKRTLATSTTRGRTKQGPPRPRQSQTHSSSSSSSSSSSDSATQPPSGEQLPLPATSTQHESTIQGLAQPVSPGPWGPQDEEFEQEAWSSILDYVPGIPHQQKPRAQGSKQNELKRQLLRSRPQDNRQRHSLHYPRPPKLPTRLLQPEESCGGLSPLAAGAARAIPQATHVSVKHGDGVSTTRRQHRRARSTRPRGRTTARCPPRRPWTTTTTTTTTCLRRKPAFEAQPPPALLVPPGRRAPQHRGLRPDQDVFEDAYPTGEAHDQPHEASGDPPGTAKDEAEEPDWSRDSQDEADEGNDDDTANHDMSEPPRCTWGSERPAEPDGAPPPRPTSNYGSREALSAEETRTERNRRTRAEWREWRRQQRRLGLAPGGRATFTRAARRGAVEEENLKRGVLTSAARAALASLGITDLSPASTKESGPECVTFPLAPPLPASRAS